MCIKLIVIDPYFLLPWLLLIRSTIESTNYVCLGYELHIRIVGEDFLENESVVSIEHTRLSSLYHSVFSCGHKWRTIYEIPSLSRDEIANNNLNEEDTYNFSCLRIAMKEIRTANTIPNLTRDTKGNKELKLDRDKSEIFLVLVFSQKFVW